MYTTLIKKPQVKMILGSSVYQWRKREKVGWGDNIKISLKAIG
jgi:hypothetical protein